MKAVIWEKYGNGDVLEYGELTKPQPGDEDVLVKVKASSVNRTDCAMLTARMFIMRLQTGLLKPKIPILGTEFSGVVEEVGRKVTQFRPGDNVFGFDDIGVQSHAEYLVVKQNCPIALMPGNSTFQEAATAIEGAHYAINFINKVPLKRGDRVMVNGGTGGIGSATLQLLKYYGAAITTTARPEHIELVKSLGANEVVDYTTDDFTEAGQLYDYVFDAVGKSSFGRCKKLLKPGGTYISSELGPNWENPFLALLAPLKRGKKVRFPLPLDKKGSILFIKELIEAEKYKPLIDRSYSVDQCSDAFNYVLQGNKVGNVVLNIDPHE